MNKVISKDNEVSYLHKGYIIRLTSFLGEKYYLVWRDNVKVSQAKFRSLNEARDFIKRVEDMNKPKGSLKNQVLDLTKEIANGHSLEKAMYVWRAYKTNKIPTRAEIFKLIEDEIAVMNEQDLKAMHDVLKEYN
jgi:hypothetical protein